jgi:hypothetical protein
MEATSTSGDHVAPQHDQSEHPMRPFPILLTTLGVIAIGFVVFVFARSPTMQTEMRDTGKDIQRGARDAYNGTKDAAEDTADAIKDVAK